MTNFELKTGKVAEKVVETYQKIEDGVVGTYQKIEEGVVGAYKKVEDAFVEKFLNETEEVETEENKDAE